MKLKSLGITILAAYLILTGLVKLLALHFTGLGQLLGLLALVAGVMLLTGK